MTNSLYYMTIPKWGKVYNNSRKETDRVPSNLVRPRPRIADRSRIEYQIDEYVEVFTRNQKWEAEGWWKAIIKNKKGSFFYVAYENANKYDDIIEKNRLRPINTRETLNARDYTQVVIPVSKDVSEWALNIEESDDNLYGIKIKSSCLILSFDPDRKNIIVVGKDKNIETAKVLIGIVLSHQAEIMQRDLISKEGSENYKDFVLIENSIWTHLGGIENKYFVSIKEKYHVEFEIVPNEEESDKQRVNITGDTYKIVTEAKSSMELESMVLTLKDKEINYLKTKVVDLQQRSKIVDTIKDEENLTLTAIGTKDALRNFKLAVETSLGFENRERTTETNSESKERNDQPPTSNSGYGYYNGSGRYQRGKGYRVKKNYGYYKYVRK